jgi:hypothetical protein
VHYITAVRLGGGAGEQHISSVRWLNADTGLSKMSPVASMVEWLEKGNTVYVGGDAGRADVQVVRPAGGAAYLRSKANGQWTDNLLKLPRY